MEDYIVKDVGLAKAGRDKIYLAERHMPLVMRLREELRRTKPFRGLTVGLALHITKETAVLVRALVDGGARVAIASCNPLSTQDDVAAALAKEGVHVYGFRGENEKEYYRFIDRVLDHEPDLTVDDGGDLITRIHTRRRNLLKRIIGGTEETTTGVIRLHAMEREGVLKYPVIAVNDNLTKHLFDNYYGTGQSTLDGILRTTNILFAGKTVVVAGYGPCGKGVSLRAKGMGADVIVTEVDPLRALQARMDGYRVMPMDRAAREGDIFITVTGDINVIRYEHILKMKDGAILANSGHFDVEIDVRTLRRRAKKRRIVRDNLEEFTLPNGKKVYLCAEGRLVNLAGAEGHPSEVMAMSFAGQIFALRYLVENKDRLEPRVYRLPLDLDRKIAEIQLKVMGIRIDRLTKEQKDYLKSWRAGT